MMLADSNVWLALALSAHPFHNAASAWLARMPENEVVVFCRSTQQSLLRLLTTEGVLEPYGLPPLSNNAAWALYENWLGDERIAFADEPPDLESYWRRLAARDTPSPKPWMPI